MAKLTLSDLVSLTNATAAITTINANSDLIEAALEKTLSRDGTSPNAMGAQLDMNSYRIINLPEATNPTDPIRLGELEELVQDQIDTVAVGPQGPTGATGAAATIAVGSTSTLSPGAPATVTNVGSSSAATFNFGIPAGQTGATGATGATGPTGPVTTVSWNFSTTTTASDPGSGIFRLNNTTPASATAMYIDNNERGGTSATAWVDSWDDTGNSTLRGHLVITDINTPTIFYIFAVSGSVVDSTGYRTVTIAYVSGAGTLTNGNQMSMTFMPRGATGSGDLSSVNNLSDVANANTSLDNLHKHGSDVASATTVNLNSTTGYYVHITGTTTITGITLTDGLFRVVLFTGALTLTHSSSLVLPGLANITTVAGDVAIFVGISGGTRCVSYQPGTYRYLQANNNLSDVLSVATTRTNLELGRTSRALPSANADNATANGWYWTTNTDTNLPTAGFYTVQVIDFNSGSRVIQIATEITGATWARVFNVTWGSWNKITDTGWKTLKPGTTETITVGYSVTPFSAGTKSSGTYTPAASDGNYQYATNGGAHTLAAPSTDCAIDILYTNNGSAGSITFSGFTVGTAIGSALTTTNTSKFIISIRRINSVATYSVYALQ